MKQLTKSSDLSTIRIKLESYGINTARSGKHIKLLVTRMIILIILVMTIAPDITKDLYGYLKSYAFWTEWSNRNVLYYYLTLFLLHPYSPKKNKLIMVMQQAIFLQQCVVVSVEWGVLAPIAIIAIPQVKDFHMPKFTDVFFKIFYHTFPYFVMLYEYKTSKGKYCRLGIYLGVGILVAYWLFMVLILGPVFNKIPYNNYFTDGKTIVSHGCFVLIASYIYWIGTVTMRNKNKRDLEGEDGESESDDSTIESA